jgi:hypothetical protein
MSYLQRYGQTTAIVILAALSISGMMGQRTCMKKLEAKETERKAQVRILVDEIEEYKKMLSSLESLTVQTGKPRLSSSN